MNEHKLNELLDLLHELQSMPSIDMGSDEDRAISKVIDIVEEELY